MAVTNVKSVSMGGGHSMMVGTYTHTANAAADTVTVAAGRVYLVNINPQISSGKYSLPRNLYSVSISDYVNTITIYPAEGITDGTFCIIYGN